MRSDRTLFYPQPLLGVGTPEVESLRSYVERLALAHRMHVTGLLDELLGEEQSVQGLCNSNTFVESWFAHGTGTMAELLAAKLKCATGMDLTCSTLGRMRAVLPSTGLTREVPLYCPVCVRESSAGALPHGRLLWLISSVDACPKHKVLLRTSDTCGAATTSVLDPANRPALQGVCRTCGSIGFDCLKAHYVEQATPRQLWVAEQVAGLLALSVERSSKLCPDTVRAGLRAAVVARFGGKSVQTSLEAGLARSTVWSWVTGQCRPSLRALLKFCAFAQCELVSVLEGGFVPCVVPCAEGAGELARRPYRRSQLTAEQIQARILQAADAEPPMSAAELGRSLDMDVRQLRTRFPKEYAILRAALSASHEVECTARLLDFECRIEAAARKLVEQGMPVNRKSLQDATGMVIYKRAGNRSLALNNVLKRMSA